MTSASSAADRYDRLKHDVARAVVAHTAQWSQWNAAVLLGTTQGVVSQLRAGKLERVSLDRLVRYALTAGLQVDLAVRHVPVLCGPQHDPPP